MFPQRKERTSMDEQTNTDVTQTSHHFLSFPHNQFPPNSLPTQHQIIEILSESQSNRPEDHHYHYQSTVVVVGEDGEVDGWRAQMERRWRLNDNGSSTEIYSHVCLEDDDDAVELVDRVLCNNNNNNYVNNAYGYANGIGICRPAKLVPVSFLSPVSATTSPPPLGFIEHPVSKFDTLAGVAIKYGVEEIDIKKMNGLVTDLQMFALKSLQIPLPGRHPPSACLSNGSNSPGESSCARQKHDDLLESFQSLTGQLSQRKVSAAMSSLQGYYGLKPAERKPKSASFDMGTVDHLENRTTARRSSSTTNSPLNLNRKSRSFANCFVNENGEPFDNQPLAEDEKMEFNRQMEKLVRRRQKSENDSNCGTPVKVLREETSSNTLISPITGRGLAQRPKAAARYTYTPSADSDAMPSGDSGSDDGFGGVKRSSSTSSLQENGASALWLAAKLKSDLQALSTAAIAIPIFDALPPITGRRNKAALD